MYKKFKLRTEGHIAELEFCAPDTHNSFDAETHTEFARALHELRALPDARVILMHAQGRSFSAGGDFAMIRRLHDDAVVRRSTLREGYDIFTLLHDLPVPLVVAMQGHAIGLGATIVTSCDVSVAYRKAKLGDPHVHIGLVAGDGGYISWAASCGMARAKRMLLTGEPLTAEEAYRCGLITDLVDTPEAALPEARAIAERIAALPPLAVQGTKQAFNLLTKQMIVGSFEHAAASEMQSAASEDLLEAMAAAVEKRPGVYNNR